MREREREREGGEREGETERESGGREEEGDRGREGESERGRERLRETETEREREREKERERERERENEREKAHKATFRKALFSSRTLTCTTTLRSVQTGKQFRDFVVMPEWMPHFVIVEKLPHLTLLLVGFLEYVNWWGGADSAPPSDLEN